MLTPSHSSLFHGLYGIAGPVVGRAPAERVEETVHWAEILLSAGARVLQLRDKESDGRTLVESARRLRELTRRFSALFIVNDRLDVALMADADGVHVGQDDLPMADVRAVAARASRPDLIVGLSTHDLEQVLAAKAVAADYIGFGPIFTTGTKRDALPQRGTGLLSEAVMLAGDLPVVAIGGIHLGNLESVLSTRVPMAAVIGDIVHANEPRERAVAIHSAFTR